MVKVLIVAFDGLQPSQISAERMPNVTKLANAGVRFLHNHCVFPTVTRANSASLVTGVYPGKHGLTANKSVFTDISTTEIVDALVPRLPEINDETGGNLLFVPTLGELISEHDLKWVSVIGGTSGNAFVQHPNADKHGDLVIHPEFTNPAHHRQLVLEQFGDWPAKSAPAADLVRRTADVTINYALSQNPDVLMVWFPEPDTSQHAFGVDSPEAIDMYSLADEQLGRVLEAVNAQNQTPDVFVVSDHGYSTIDEVVAVRAELEAAGFKTFGENPDVVIAENEGSVLFYVPSDSDDLIKRLLDWLSTRNWVGAVATSPQYSTDSDLASIAAIGLSGVRQPSIAITMRSTDTGKDAPRSASGASADGSVGVGAHGGGSSAEMHNTMIASGPSFLTETESELPSGNIDVLPTILEILGVSIPDHLDGRVLSEALVSDDPNSRGPEASLENLTSVVKAKTGPISYLCKFG